MEILAFNICGKFAHFRKYYANNTAMSFTIPPRTTIMGILGAVLGIEKESYHEVFDSKNLDVSVAVKSALKKSFHRLNLLSIKSTSDFSGKGGHIQTPFEVVSGLNLREDEVIYRIYLRNRSLDLGLWKQMVKSILNKQPVYNLTLGTANFQAQIRDSEYYLDQQIELVHNLDDFIPVVSVVNISEILSVKFSDHQKVSDEMLEEELLPADFVGNGTRELSAMNRLLFSAGNYPIWVRLDSNAEVINILPEENNICFQKPVE